MNEFGDFLLERELGQGASARVYLATHKRDPGKKRVALKVFHPGLWDREDFRRRAEAEERVISILKHPNIVGMVESFFDHDPAAVALEYIEGLPLEEFQARLPYVLPEISVLILIEILKALEHAHANGVIHRDLKPANILVGTEGRILVSDFGLAKFTDLSRNTVSGSVLGSPDFMSPEQARGEAATPRSDLFSAAAILYFLVTGTRPFNQNSPLTTLAAVCAGDFEAPERRNPKVAAQLSDIIKKGLNPEPSRRFSLAGEFRALLEKYLVDIGLSSEWFSIANWIRDTAKTTILALRTIAECLIVRTEKAIESGDFNEALEGLASLGRIAPESPALSRLEKQLDLKRNRRRNRSAMIIFGLGACVIGVSVMTFLFFNSHLQIPQAQMPQVLVNKPISKMVQLEAPHTSAQPIRRPDNKEYVRFDVARGVRVFWDGRKINPIRRLLGQKPGAHTIRLEKDGAMPIVRSVIVERGEPTIIRAR